MTTPFIRTPRNSGGSLYIFNSSTEDLNFLINDSEERSFVWSKFVLLNLPDELRPTAKNENYIQYDSINGAYDHTINKTPDVKMAESLQNYCLNFENILLANDGYDVSLKRSVSERVFFKWLKELGAIRFKQALKDEKSGLVEGVRFTEEQSDGYTKIVKYIGDIDMVNSNKFQQNSYSEIYIHVPISHGFTKTVLFDTIEDSNYVQNKYYQNISSTINENYLFGRDINDVHPFGLSTFAFYDSDTASYNTSTYSLFKEFIDEQGKRYINESWYKPPISNAYITSKDFSDQHNDKLKIVGNSEFFGRDIVKLRSRLDGISLDFDTNSYYDIVTNPSIHSFAEYNQSKSGDDFNFNTVLLYYDVFETANPENKVSNLFGVLFLHKPEAKSTGGSTIPSFIKYKPNEVTGDNGNAWGLKVNLKLDVSTSDAQIETVVNEYNTFSMELFLEAMSELKRTSENLESVNETHIILKQKVDELENYVYRIQDVEELKVRYNELYNIINSNQDIFSKNNELISLIQRAFEEINNIYANKTSIQVAYNLDVINDGFGIKIQNVNNKKKINLDIQEYLIHDKTIYSIVNDSSIINNEYTLTVPNLRYTQLIRIEEPQRFEFVDNFNLEKNINILINDEFIRWQRGKKIRISFGTNYTSNNIKTINIYTDAIDRQSTGKNYNVRVNNFVIKNDIFNIKTIEDNLAILKRVHPIIEITCIDAENLQFITDVF